jgi:hypothetical protein
LRQIIFWWIIFFLLICRDKIVRNEKSENYTENLFRKKSFNHFINYLNFSSMKKKILSGVFALTLLVATGYGVNKSMNSNVNLSDLTLKNVEALAQSEGGGGCRWATRETWLGWEAICISTGVGYDCTCGSVKPYY